MSERDGIDRRTFFKIAGGGIVVFVSLGPGAVFGQRRRRAYPEDLNAYLHIGENGRVTVFSGKIEMGQGVMTSQAQMAAEELGVALGAVEMVLGDTDRCPWDMGTFGSLTTRMFGPVLRTAAAEARAVLLGLASKTLGVGVDRLLVADGVVSVAGLPGRRVTYGELTRGRRIARTVHTQTVLRNVTEFTVMGRSPERLDARAKVTGEARYAGDIHRDGMLYARILRPPAHGAKLESLDTRAAAAMPGVKVVTDGGLTAVLHPDPEAAAAALGAVQARWSSPEPEFGTETVFDHILRTAAPAETPLERGDLPSALGRAARTFESEYRKGYVAHAPMETHTAVAELEDGKLTVWASTQTPFPTHDRLAEELGLAPDEVRVITPYVGGGFGGKSAGLQASEAARLARLTGVPVQVAWTREEEFFYDTFDPAAVVRLISAVDHAGLMTVWDYHVFAAGDRGTDLFYDVPNARIRVSGSWHGDGSGPHLFGTGPWRAPGANMNVFAKESQIDLMAAAIGADPVEFRLHNTSDTRMLRVIRAAAKASGWKPGAAPRRTGRGRGVACGIDAGTYVALVADITVDRTSGAISVDRLVAAQEMGVVVNPEGATMQMEGCLTMGLGYPLTEELRFEGGRILDTNFDTYSIPRFSAVPRIETVLVPNDDLAPQGGGEPAIVPMGAVLANALFDATGARLYRLPLTPERVRAALKPRDAAEAASTP